MLNLILFSSLSFHVMRWAKFGFHNTFNETRRGKRVNEKFSSEINSRVVPFWIRFRGVKQYCDECWKRALCLNSFIFVRYMSSYSNVHRDLYCFSCVLIVTATCYGSAAIYIYRWVSVDMVSCDVSFLKLFCASWIFSILQVQTTSFSSSYTNITCSSMQLVMVLSHVGTRERFTYMLVMWNTLLI